MAGPVKKPKAPNHSFRVATDAIRGGYRREREARLGPRLDARREIARSLAPEAAVLIFRDTAFATCPPGTLAGVPAVVQFARDTVGRVDIEQMKRKANKPFMMKLLGTDSLGLDSALLRLGLERSIVASAAAYLGIVPILQYANVFYSSYSGEEAVKSQLLHCDSDDTEQMKVFVLCDEVTPESGPLTFVPPAPSETLRELSGYKYKTRLTDARARELVGEAGAGIPILGPAGTAAFLDTSRCFHFGSRFADVTSRRVVAMLQYVTPLAFILPDDYWTGAQFRHLATSATDELTNLVLGAS